MEDIGGLLHATFGVMPMPILIVDDDMRILFFNPMAKRLIPPDKADVHNMRAGEALVCQYALDKGCGRGEFCPECILRQSTGEAIKGKRVIRKKAKMKILRDGNLKDINLFVTAAPVEHKGKKLAMLMLEDVNEIIQLAPYLAICAGCNKIRDKKGKWTPFEEYLSSHINVDFSHSFCPDCIERLYPDVAERLKKKKKKEEG